MTRTNWNTYRIKKRWFRTNSNIFTPLNTASSKDWGVDFEEHPPSYLPFVHYQKWVGKPPIDLTNAIVHVDFKSDLKLHGAKLYFWIVAVGIRWYCMDEVPVDGHSEIELNLSKEWKMTWKKNDCISVHKALTEVISYGFGFYGFKHPVTGNITMLDFGITADRK